MKNIIFTLSKVLQRNKNLIQNFSYLSALQIFNMVLPLVTYPYLIRALGKETYGLVVYAQAIVGYLVILVGFGFNVSATKEISIYRNNKEKLSEIVSSVFIIKSVLFILAFIILYVILNLIPQAKNNKLLFLLTMWMCLYDVIFPVWYFQGIEQMKYITYMNLLSRLIFLGLIFLFINSINDYLLLPVISGIGALLAGITSLIIVFVKHRIKFTIQPYKVLKHYFLDSVVIFISNISIIIYASTNKVLIGTFLGMSEVAYFDLAEKLISTIKTPLIIVGQTLFPKISKDKNRLFFKKSFLIVGVFVLFICFISFLMIPIIIRLLGGMQMLPVIPIFRIMIISLLPIVISLFYGNLALLAWGFSKEYLKSRLVTALFYISIIIVLIFLNKINIYTMALITVIVEFITMFLILYYCKINNIIFGSSVNPMGKLTN